MEVIAVPIVTETAEDLKNYAQRIDANELG